MRSKNSDSRTAEVRPPVSTTGQVAVIDADRIVRIGELNVSCRILTPVPHRIGAVGLLHAQPRYLDIGPVAAAVQILDVANSSCLLRESNDARRVALFESLP